MQWDQGTAPDLSSAKNRDSSAIFLLRCILEQWDGLSQCILHRLEASANGNTQSPSFKMTESLERFGDTAPGLGQEMPQTGYRVTSRSDRAL